MKKIFQITIHLIMITIMLFSVFSTTFAQTPAPQTNKDYVVLQPLPGIGDNANKTTNLPDYLKNAFNLTIGIAAALAFIMITWGGVMYATSDAIEGKSQGREYITNAIWGLLLVIGAWVILYTINPQILNFSLVLWPRPDIKIVGVPGITPGVKMTEAQLAEHAANLAKLGSVKINNNGKPCENGETTGCTNLNGLPPKVIPGLQSLVIACSCEIKINGGTEGGHASHGIGLPVIDLDENPGLRAYIEKQTQRVQGNIKIISWKNSQGGTAYQAGFVYESTGKGRSTGNHWHVSF